MRVDIRARRSETSTAVTYDIETTGERFDPVTQRIITRINGVDVRSIDSAGTSITKKGFVKNDNVNP